MAVNSWDINFARVATYTLSTGVLDGARIAFDGTIFEEGTVHIMQLGDSWDPVYSLLDRNGSPIHTFDWDWDFSSSDQSVVLLNATHGWIDAVGEGSATITARVFVPSVGVFITESLDISVGTTNIDRVAFSLTIDNSWRDIFAVVHFEPHHPFSVNLSFTAQWLNTSGAVLDTRSFNRVMTRSNNSHVFQHALSFAQAQNIADFRITNLSLT